MVNITAFFTNKGVPTTGLSATIDVWKLDGTQVVTAQAMTEVAGGFYFYNFTTYDEDLDYVIRADGSATLTGSDRYVYSSNETAGVGKILQIEKGSWSIVGNQMIFYDTDGTTPLYTFDLKDKGGAATDNNVFKRVRV
ncbi:MAG: hypothetical protein ACTSWD_04935 [Candidatus Heimdallarchaeota archaeon]